MASLRLYLNSEPPGANEKKKLELAILGSHILLTDAGLPTGHFGLT
jgi:hypothetical protein